MEKCAYDAVSVVPLSRFCAVSPQSRRPHAAKGPTVAGELKRLAAEGAITPEDAAAHRALYDDARAKVKRLTGARKAELGGVVKDLEDMAARGSFDQPSRLPALFLTLQRNVEYWSSQPLLRAGARLSFPGSELVFQLYPGHGLQIQWLGTFGKLNGYWSGGKRYDARAGALLDEALPLATERAGGLAWEYLFPFDGQNPPWVSSLAQGTGPAGDGALGHPAQAPGRGLPDRAARARDLPDRAARGRARGVRRRRALPAVLGPAEAASSSTASSSRSSGSTTSPR